VRHGEPPGCGKWNCVLCNALGPDFESLPQNPEDLLSEDEKRALAEDLKRIHDTMYPCWGYRLPHEH
jgi:hypothetical protein